MGPSDSCEKIEAAQPGDEVVVAPGTYRIRIHLTRQAPSSQPIVIRAQDPSSPPVRDRAGTLVEDAPGSKVVAVDNDARIPGLTLDVRLVSNTLVGNGGRAALVDLSSADGTAMRAEISNNLIAGTPRPRSGACSGSRSAGWGSTRGRFAPPVAGHAARPLPWAGDGPKIALRTSLRQLGGTGPPCST